MTGIVYNMANIGVDGQLSTRLCELLDGRDSIEPGDQAGYQLCKLLWEFHPLGGKLVEKPITMALFKSRINTLDDDPDNRIIAAFEDTWMRLGITEKIRNLYFVARCYGAAAIAVGEKEGDSNEKIDLWKLDEDNIFINVFDPLNVAGSMVTSQDPNSSNFQQANEYITTFGQTWHPSRTLKVFNGTPIYLSFQNSTFGFTGRSVFQRALYPLRSFLLSMKVDNMVSKKSGLLIAKIKQNGSVVSGLMAMATGFKRSILKAGETDEVLSIGETESIESLNLQNIDGAMKTARDNIIANIASASDIPSILIKDEAFATGFGEGSEDSKAIAQYVDYVRQAINPSILFFERIVQHIAWNEAFFTALKNDYPEQFGDRDYQAVFYEWQRNFKSEWPTLLETPEHEVRKGESEVIKQAVEFFSVVAPNLDNANRSKLIAWMADRVNSLESCEDSPLVFDYDDLENFTPPQPTSMGMPTNEKTED